ncbi:uncharacterized protein LOC120265240 [Dioscorea cayenensis subsp. rotundata]|uniref:Uncharacterized protein LOC120265240 n=1 Tax=Dioscorea cayennensis subsp. rotundata TaxID=55577 RepID=A0AB40BNR0_DIOCR|nr:uncharacterized protein LOC120265240 [Dioscorea cayenensis subsp. rotundata]
MIEDPAEDEVGTLSLEENIEDEIGNITAVEPTNEWTELRNQMAVDIMDSESQQRGRGQNKRYWTAEEDKALIDALVELSVNPIWRAENGFRGGYLLQLEKMIKDKIPQTMLKAVPNIESRVKLLRTKTTAIVDILRVSGFDWNYERSTIMCEKSAYDEYVKAHKEAAGLYGKSFPFFNYLVAVFTKDRAYGNARADIGDEARQVENEDDNIFEEDVGFSQVSIEEFSMPSQENDETPLATPMESSKDVTQRHLHKEKEKEFQQNQLWTKFQ